MDEPVLSLGVPPLLLGGLTLVLAAAAMMLIVPPTPALPRSTTRARGLGPAVSASAESPSWPPSSPRGRASQSSHPSPPDAAMLLDLTAALLAAGVGIEAALDRLARTIPGAEPLAAVHRSLAAGRSWDRAWELVAEPSPRREGHWRALAGTGGRRPGGQQRARRPAGAAAERSQLAELGAQLSFAHATGAPSAELLRVGARQLRRRRRHEAQRRAEELGVAMVLPLGACFLPAFILLGVMPVVLGLLPEVFSL